MYIIKYKPHNKYLLTCDVLLSNMKYTDKIEKARKYNKLNRAKSFISRMTNPELWEAIEITLLLN